MVRVALSSASIHLNDALGRQRFELNPDGKSVVQTAGEESPSLNMLEMPAEVASHSINTIDLCIQHIPSIDSSYLAELRSALEESEVELFQLLIDLGNVSSTEPQERNADMAMTKRWMEIATELGARGVRYVPGDSEPSPETIRLSADAFRELADYANECGIKPATENYKTMTKRTEDLLQILELSEREYGLVADFGNARGPNKYETLAQLVPRATSIHAWGEYDEDGTFNTDDFRRCLLMAHQHDFDGPIMLLGGLPAADYRNTRDLWGGVDELRAEVTSVFGN